MSGGGDVGRKAVFRSALDAIREAVAAAPTGVNFPSALHAVDFAMNEGGKEALLEPFERELRHSLHGSVWIEDSEKKYLKPRLLASLEDFVMAFIEEEWNLTKPSLIVSVTGGATDFLMDLGSTPEERRRRSKALGRFIKRGLVRGAQRRGNAWFMTGGFDTGCMRMVGDAVRQLSEHGLGVTAIGVCTFGRVNRSDVFIHNQPVGGRVYNLDSLPDPGKAWLSPDHTHFLMVGDEDSDWGTEIQFRSELEERYQSSGVPVVMIVINGGVGTLNTVHRAVKDGFDICVVRHSGRIADLIALGMDVRDADIEHFDIDSVIAIWRSSPNHPELWSISEEELFLRKLKDILLGGRLSIFDLDFSDVSEIEEKLANAQCTRTRFQSHLYRGVDAVMQATGTVIGTVELHYGVPPPPGYSQGAKRTSDALNAMGTSFSYGGGGGGGGVGDANIPNVSSVMFSSMVSPSSSDLNIVINNNRNNINNNSNFPHPTFADTTNNEIPQRLSPSGGLGGGGGLLAATPTLPPLPAPPVFLSPMKEEDEDHTAKSTPASARALKLNKIVPIPSPIKHEPSSNADEVTGVNNNQAAAGAAADQQQHQQGDYENHNGNSNGADADGNKIHGILPDIHPRRKPSLPGAGESGSIGGEENEEAEQRLVVEESSTPPLAPIITLSAVPRPLPVLQLPGQIESPRSLVQSSVANLNSTAPPIAAMATLSSIMSSSVGDHLSRTMLIDEEEEGGNGDDQFASKPVRSALPSPGPMSAQSNNSNSNYNQLPSPLQPPRSPGSFASDSGSTGGGNGSLGRNQSSLPSRGYEEFASTTLQRRVADFFRPPSALLPPHDLLGVMLIKWGLQLPKIMLSIGGGLVRGDAYPKAREIFRSIVSVADLTDGWIMTSAIAKTAADMIDAKAANRSPVIGFCTLKRLHGREIIAHPRTGNNHVRIYGSPEEGKDALSRSHSHFILVGDRDDDKIVKIEEDKYDHPSAVARRKTRRRGQEKDPGHLLRARLEEHVQQVHHAALVFIICNGSIKTLSSVLRAARTNVPILIIGGTGRVASLLASVYRMYKSNVQKFGFNQRQFMLALEALTVKYFPNLVGDQDTILDVIEDCLEIVEEGVIYVVDVNQPNAPARVKHILRRVAVEKGTVGVEDNLGESSLMFAARTGNEELAMRMLTQGDRLTTPDEKSLLLALQYGRYNIAQAVLLALLETAHEKRRPTTQQILEATDDDGNTPLMWAAYHGFVDLMQGMEDAATITACSPNVTSMGAGATSGGDNISPTAAAAAAVATRITPESGSGGAAGAGIGGALTARAGSSHDLNNSNNNNNNNNNTVHISPVSSQGFVVDARNCFGHSALHFAVRGGSVRACQWLMQRGADPLLPPPMKHELPKRVAQNVRRANRMALGADPDEDVENEALSEIKAATAEAVSQEDACVHNRGQKRMSVNGEIPNNNNNNNIAALVSPTSRKNGSAVHFSQDTNNNNGGEVSKLRSFKGVEATTAPAAGGGAHPVPLSIDPSAFASSTDWLSSLLVPNMSGLVDDARVREAYFSPYHEALLGMKYHQLRSVELRNQLHTMQAQRKYLALASRSDKKGQHHFFPQKKHSQHPHHHHQVPQFNFHQRASSMYDAVKGSPVPLLSDFGINSGNNNNLSLPGSPSLKRIASRSLATSGKGVSTPSNKKNNDNNNNKKRRSAMAENGFLSSGGGGGGGGLSSSGVIGTGAAEMSQIAHDLELTSMGGKLLEDVAWCMFSKDGASANNVGATTTPMFHSEKEDRSGDVRWHRSVFALRQFGKWAGAYILYLVIACIVASMMVTNLSYDTFLLTSQVGDSVTEWPMEGLKWYRMFEQIKNKEEFWLWFEAPLLMNLMAPSTAHEPAGEARPVLGHNWLVGPLRLRQLRVHGGHCETVGEESQWECFPSFSEEHESRESYGDLSPEFTWRSSEETGSPWMFGTYIRYPGSGFVADLHRTNISHSLHIAHSLEANEWIDDATRVVFIDYTLYNEALRLLLFNHLSVEFLATGGTKPFFRIVAAPYTHTLTTDYVVLRVLQVILLIANLYFITEEITDLRQAIMASNGSFRSGLLSYVQTGFNLWDVVNIILFAMAAFLELAMSLELNSRFQHGLLEEEYYEMYPYVQMQSIQRDVITFFILLSLLKLVKYLQLIPSVGPILQGIFFTFTDRVIFLFISFLLMCVFILSISFHIAFGHAMNHFHTLEKSWFTIMCIIFGDEIEFSYVEEYKGFNGPSLQGGAAGVLFGVLTISRLILIHITVAVLMNCYENAMKEHTSATWERMLSDLQASSLWESLPLRIRYYVADKNKPEESLLPGMELGPTHHQDNLPSSRSTTMDETNSSNSNNDEARKFPNKRKLRSSWVLRVERMWRQWMSDSDRVIPRYVGPLPERAILQWKDDGALQEKKGQKALIASLSQEISEFQDRMTANVDALTLQVQKLAATVHKKERVEPRVLPNELFHRSAKQQAAPAVTTERNKRHKQLSMRQETASRLRMSVHSLVGMTDM